MSNFRFERSHSFWIYVETGDTVQRAAPHLYFRFYEPEFKAPTCSINIRTTQSHWSPPCCTECVKLIKVTTDMLWTLLHCGTDDWRGGHFPAGRCFPLWIRRRKYRQAKHFSRLLLTFPPGKPPETCHCRCELTLYFLSCMLSNL